MIRITEPTTTLPVTPFNPAVQLAPHHRTVAEVIDAGEWPEATTTRMLYVTVETPDATQPITIGRLLGGAS